MRNKKNKGIRIPVLILLITSLFSFQGCKNTDDIIDGLSSLLEILNKTGWLEEKEDVNNIPDDITPFNDEEGSTFKESISLEHLFPPIGNQGEYGTCVTWAVGYNLKTALNAVEKGWSSGQLDSRQNQTSPKDLWMAIPSSKKGSNCEGTNFEPALDALISDGASSLDNVPYTNLGNCAGTKIGDSKNQLANYRKIGYVEGSKSDGMTLENFKGYLNAGRPIVFGAKLGDRFMTWSNASVINSDTYTKPGMQHAYHAMVLVGYDNAKNAFKVRNSWGTSWGDKGSIWVDYNFFLKNFCFVAFVAQNKNSATADNGTITSGLSNGTDVMAFFAEDHHDEDYTSLLERKFSYQVYNSGTTEIKPSSKWSVVYMYYNATNASDYEVIFEDYYTNQWGEEGDNDEYDAPGAGAGWWNNVSVQAGKIAGETEYGEEGFWVYYTMPDHLNGKYYLVVMADAFEKLDEVNEDNNFYFITANNGKPLEFRNGIIQNEPKMSARKRFSKSNQPGLFANTFDQTPVKPGNLNAYTPAELRAQLLHDKKTGKLDQVIKKHRASKSNKQLKVKRISK